METGTLRSSATRTRVVARSASNGVNGRHNRGAGFAADLENYLEASLAGWRVVRLGPNEITFDIDGRIIALVSK